MASDASRTGVDTGFGMSRSSSSSSRARRHVSIWQTWCEVSSEDGAARPGGQGRLALGLWRGPAAGSSDGRRWESVCGALRRLWRGSTDLRPGRLRGGFSCCYVRGRVDS